MKKITRDKFWQQLRCMEGWTVLQFYNRTLVATGKIIRTTYLGGPAVLIIAENAGRPIEIFFVDRFPAGLPTINSQGTIIWKSTEGHEFRFIENPLDNPEEKYFVE